MSRSEERQHPANAPPPIDWESLLLVWLHDPLDKALDVRGHEARAARYASAALGREVTRLEMKRTAATADPLAAAIERIPAPNAGPGGARAVGPADGLSLLHPLCGEETPLSAGRVDEERVRQTICGIVDSLRTPRERFLALWRLLPERAAQALGRDAALLPADTRFPDHTLFQHADTAAGLSTAFSHPGGAAFISFSIGPVQPFIAAARSVRDLWSGSAIISWLAFHAMAPILENCGPTALVYPSLRGAPLVDLWLRRQGDLSSVVEAPETQAKTAPSLPNRFVALAPSGPNGRYAAELRRHCLDAARAAWLELADAVRARVAPTLARLDPGWDTLWQHQIDGMFDFRCVVVPERELDESTLAALAGARTFDEAWPDAAAIRGLAQAIPAEARPGYRQASAGRWQAQMDYVARLHASARSVRPSPGSTPPGDGPWPPKCTLFGSWEQVGPTELAGSAAFWRAATKRLDLNGVRVREGERLCAVALTKRFAAPAHLAAELEVDARRLRFPDTATVAAARWLKRAGLDPAAEGRWNGQWLHWRQPDQDQDEEAAPEGLWRRLRDARKPRQQGAPPTYYAVLAMDGDNIGDWLAGRKTPPLGQLIHPKLKAWYERLSDPKVARSLAARRHVTPALHTTISSALGAFATRFAPLIVNEHGGTVIYSGGDDLLCLCPVETALACANDLRRAFSGNDEASRSGFRGDAGETAPTMGARATMSAGLAIVHYKEDLRLALATAREAERAAKTGGRDRLRIIVMRRSGERHSCPCPWQVAARIDELREAFAAGSSDGWTYKLRAEAPVLGLHLPVDAQCAELRRLVRRSEGESVRSGDDPVRAVPGLAEKTVALYREFLAGASEDESYRTSGAGASRRTSARPFTDFATLCQTAAFMARGRDA